MAFRQSKKNKIWIWRALDGVSHRAIYWHVGDRSDASLRELIQHIDNGNCTFVKDKWEGFFRCLSEDRHFFGKDLTFVIESTNSDIRHRLACFKRRSKASSRSLDMVHRSLLLFHYFQDNHLNIENLIQPLLSSFG